MTGGFALTGNIGCWIIVDRLLDALDWLGEFEDILLDLHEGFVFETSDSVDPDNVKCSMSELISSKEDSEYLKERRLFRLVMLK